MQYFKSKGKNGEDAHFHFSPCIMSCGAALQHNIPRIVIGENQVRVKYMVILTWQWDIFLHFHFRISAPMPRKLSVKGE